MRYFDIDKQNRTYKFSRELWVSYGDPETVQMLSDNPSQLPFAIKPGGSDMLYLSDKEISKLDKSLKKPSSAPFDSIQWDYAKERRSDKSVSYNMAWQPGTSLVFLYSEGAMQGGGYTFILNADTGQVCELDLGGWAKEARWSSDGRYLAFISVKDYAFLYPRSELALLDITTGNLTMYNVTPREIPGQHYVRDFTWAPDNHHLLAIGEIYTSSDNQSETGLYLVDSVSGQSINIAPAYELHTNSPQSLALSPDGSNLVFRCPTMRLDQICFISVQTDRR
jgi:Tol biopolymer transport system component